MNLPEFSQNSPHFAESSASSRSERETNRDLYDSQSALWVRTEPSVLSDFTGRPPTLELCQPVRGLSVLDLGCGEGYCARLLKQAGATSVLGIDISGEMIEQARVRERSEQLGISFEVGDATDLSGIPDASIDLAIAMFLFNYLDINDTLHTFREIKRVLVSGGKFVFAVPHPALAFLHKSGQPPFYFEAAEWGYFSGRNRSFPGKIWRRNGTALEVRAIHKTFEDYTSALKQAGFIEMPDIRELGVTEEMIELDPEFFSPALDLPLHLAFRIVKTRSQS